jgi:hypothetical protein
MRPYDFCGRENHESAEKLSQGLTGKIVGRGQSMTPILKDKQAVICEPVKEDTVLKKNDIVLCKVNGHYYLHLIWGIKNGKEYQIGNNHGHPNGWVSRNQIYGKVVEKL